MTAQLAGGDVYANRFEIERTAGVGGMSTVYRARDRVTGEVIALKVMSASSSENYGLDRFQREAQLLAELRHPGIVAYKGHGQTAEGERYLAMEWLDGIDLSQRLKRGPLSLADAYLLLSRTTDALDVAHQRGIVHRDLNPNNLFLPGGDLARVKLLDFGIARRTTVAHAVTRTGLVIGTPEYMAPEQVRGVRDVTPAADIFALGCVLYKCLTGEPPFSADQVAALLVRILFEEPIPLRHKRPEIPDSISSLLRRMLHKDPTQRIANAGELVMALATLGELVEAPASAGPAAPPSLSGFARTEQLLYSLVVASLLPPDESDVAQARVEEVRRESSQEQELVSELRTLGLIADFLVGGLLVVTVPPTGTANDQAARAARVGLMIKERWPRAVVAVATGRGAAQRGSTVGEVVDRATRLLHHGSRQQAEAPPPAQSGVWLDALSTRLLSGRFSIVAMDGQSLLWSEEKEADASRPLLGKPTLCVGRDAELGMLEGQLQSCIEDAEARAVRITAAPGVGKSRLRHEFLRRVEKLNPDLSVWPGRGDPMRIDSAYSLLGEAIRRLCGLTGSESDEVARQRLTQRVGQSLQELPQAEQRRVILFVGELCGVRFPEQGNPMLGAARQDPKIMRERIRRAFLDFLLGECATAPVLLVLDDLQWGDALSVSLIDDALHELKGAPLCVLGLGRPELHQVFPGLWQNHRLQDIQLKELGRKPCERLIQQVLGRQVAPELMARLIEQSAGNALFLEELIRSVVAGKAEIEADTVVAMLQVRIGRFEPASRRALQAAAIFGQTFWRGGVATVLGIPQSAPEAANWLTALLHAEVIEPHPATRIADDKEYGFRHGLVRDAAYGLLTDDDRRTGHRLAGEFLQAAESQEAAAIAEHYELGGDPARAAGFYARAAEQALSNADHRSAQNQLERGLACQPSDETLATLRSVELAVMLRQNRFDRLYELVPAALSLARPGTRAWSRTLSVAVQAATLGPPELRAQQPQLIQMLLSAQPQPDARVAYAEALSSMAIALATSSPKSLVRALLGRLRSVVSLQASSNPTFQRWYLWAYCHNLHHREPQPYSALLAAEEGIRQAQVAGDRLIQVSLTILPKAFQYFRLGAIDEAVRLLRDAMKEAARVDGFLFELARQTLARVLCEVGEEAALEEAVRLSQAAIEQAGGALMFIGMAHHNLATVLLKRNQSAVDAAMKGYQALQAAPLYCVDVAATLVTALLADGKTAEALPVVQEALGIVVSLSGAGYAEVPLRLAASEAFHAAGELPRARTELQATLHQIRLRTYDITDPAWRDRYLTRNPACVRAQLLAAQWGIVE